LNSRVDHGRDRANSRAAARNAASRSPPSLPDDWVAPLIERIAADNQIRHVRVAREAEAIAICSGRSLAACARSP
jgi:sulfopyruvate decarboxylase TPP-binding subunit